VHRSGIRLRNESLLLTPISREAIAARACERCGEYTFKKFAIRPAGESQREALDVAWIARKTCGVCGSEQEVGIDPEGEIVFAG
jgi:hypothetical protein